MSSRRITWAKDLEQIVCEVDTLNLEERRAYWYAKNELRKICRGDASLASQFRQMGYTELKEAEAHFSHKGHSLRGLGMMKDDPMIFQAKVVKANRSMLGSQTAKSEAMKISRQNAKAAYKMGLYDEKVSRCYCTEAQNNHRRSFLQHADVSPCIFKGDSISCSKHDRNEESRRARNHVLDKVMKLIGRGEQHRC
uniref:Uncharacterized protein n=1 Tax=Leptocylindrus danicus TaxID=163516 RepID=A0A7S2NXR3_9STRA|mmetsp:Transcript_16352/g.24117  ORF Transcript_16352/g.24117 Transcript_16352/m.24117 type:complete len:195 (+) Transcript_16352:193-777(+)